MGLKRVVVKVPASTANLGPAFDCLGLALDIFNTVTAEGSDAFTLSITGEGERTLPRNQSNRVYQGVEAVFHHLGRSVPPLAIACHNAIPLMRGLGSSAAAVLGGIMAANALNDSPLGENDMLRLAVTLEGHPDNVAPSLAGGCQLVVREHERWVTSRVAVSPDLTFVLFIPDFRMSTAEARELVPESLDRTVATFNIGRAALLVLALATGEKEELRLATQDRLHQPARQALFPAMPKLFESALAAGAFGAFLSGAGSTVVALAQKDQDSDTPRVIAEAMTETAREAGLSGETRLANLSATGAQVVARG